MKKSNGIFFKLLKLGANNCPKISLIKLCSPAKDANIFCANTNGQKDYLAEIGAQMAACCLALSPSLCGSLSKIWGIHIFWLHPSNSTACKAKRQYLLTSQVSRYCFSALQNRAGGNMELKFGKCVLFGGLRSLQLLFVRDVILPLI